jgi:S-adenosylmethionine:tRNA ribosyltransferase-isomerase
MRTDELDFDLPSELIAQAPMADRSGSRLLRYQRESKGIEDRRFVELPDVLGAGDLLVFNDARVIPAKFVLRKSTGGRIEGLFLSEPEVGHWRVMLKNLGHAPVGTELEFESEPGLVAKLGAVFGEGEYLLEIFPAQKAFEVLDRVGRMPLPPYIKREKGADPLDELDRDRYQTIYADAPGAVAAPTAGLHFTAELLEHLREKGVEMAKITLHVGAGTFKPVNADTLESHVMHRESYVISPMAAEQLNRAKFENRRIVAVGTTSARVLESWPPDKVFEEWADSTQIFIYPPYRWKHVDALITNFHLPRSTLIALVAAMTGLEEQRRIYGQAIEKGYRFFSYGDAMLIE